MRRVGAGPDETKPLLSTACAVATCGALSPADEETLLIAATANVCTLGCGDQRSCEKAGLAVSGRSLLRQRQFHDKGYNVIGVQEARLPQAEPRDTADYRI